MLTGKQEESPFKSGAKKWDLRIFLGQAASPYETNTVSLSDVLERSPALKLSLYMV